MLSSATKTHTNCSYNYVFCVYVHRVPSPQNHEITNSRTLGWTLQADPVEGKRWFRQTQADFAALTTLHQAGQHYHVVCFLAQQVAEKALKSVLFCVGGMDRSHETNHSLATMWHACPASLRGNFAGT